MITAIQGGAAEHIAIALRLHTEAICTGLIGDRRIVPGIAERAHGIQVPQRSEAGT